jgi:DNA-binding SARP family transcriptional activator
MDSPLRIKMFGPFNVWREGDTSDSLQELRSHKMAMQLLAFLILYSNRQLPKPEATSLFWDRGGVTEDNLNRLIQTLYKSLGSDDGWRVTSVARTVRLDVSGMEVDTLLLDQAWEQRAQDLTPLVNAIDACDGPLLQGWDSEWAEAARARYAEKYRQALYLLTRSAIKSAAYQTAQHYLHRLRRAGDCAETLHIALMEAWMKAQAFPSAQQFYTEYRDYLRREHRLHPPARMTELYESIPKADADFEPPVESHLVEMEAPGGTLPLTSRFYIERPLDKDFHTALARRDGTILINGPRQVGKSSLLARGIAQAQQAGLRVVLTDFQKLDAENLQSIETFYRALMRSFQRKLSLEGRSDDHWDSYLSPNENFDSYLQDVVLSGSAVPLVWCIDEADRIFDRDYRGSVFGLLRSRHNARAEEPDSLWKRFLLVMTYSTEARLFIPDQNMSPFNVGTKITLEDFTPEQVGELNVRHGSPLQSAEEVRRLCALVGGHPYLVRLCLYEMQGHGLTVEDLEAQADQDFSLFRDHLDGLYAGIIRDSELAAGVRSLLRGEAALSPLVFVRLRSAGVVTGKAAASARLRCGLYAAYFQRHLQ